MFLLYVLYPYFIHIETIPLFKVVICNYKPSLEFCMGSGIPGNSAVPAQFG